MQIRFLSGTGIGAARVVENVNAEQIKRDPAFAHLFAQDGKYQFSVFIAEGRGETFFKKIDGAWNHSTHYVDRCFGIIKTRWQPVRA